MVENFWDLLVEHPDYAVGVAALFNWSTNCEHPTPAAAFADMIGATEDVFGEQLCQRMPDMGYLELDYLADALKEYATRPDEVRAFTVKLLQADE